MRRAVPFAYSLFATPSAFAAFNLAKEYSGTSFFNGWDFGNGTFDSTTHGEYASLWHPHNLGLTWPLQDMSTT